MMNITKRCPYCTGEGLVYSAGVDGNSAWSKTTTCPHCNGRGLLEVPMTNADRIRAMSDEELGKIFTTAVADECPPKMDWDCAKDEFGWDACDACWCKWLQQPAEVE